MQRKNKQRNRSLKGKIFSACLHPCHIQYHLIFLSDNASMRELWDRQTATLRKQNLSFLKGGICRDICFRGNSQFSRALRENSSYLLTWKSYEMLKKNSFSYLLDEQPRFVDGLQSCIIFTVALPNECLVLCKVALDQFPRKKQAACRIMIRNGFQS